MWLLEQEIEKNLRQAYASGFTPTAEGQARFQASIDARVANTESPILSIAGECASILVEGVLTNSPDFIAMFFGGGNTTYPEIITALAQAEQNPSVQKIEILYSSPGGHVDGLFEAVAALQAATKPIYAIVSPLCASAAYALAAQSTKIIAKNSGARVGSLGVAVDFQISENVVSVASTLAPKKRPDLTTEEGKAVVREELDALHELFTDVISQGRRESKANINTQYGQGATLLAASALKRGMIDEIAKPMLQVVGGEALGQKNFLTNESKEVIAMDLNEIKAKYPQAYAEAVSEGEQRGVSGERDRVVAHLIMGEQSGDMATAVTAIKEGSDMTATLQSTYLAAALNRRDVQNRAEDETQASALGNPNQETPTAESDADKVVAMVEQHFGVST